MTKLILCGLAALATALPTASHAATILWGTAQNISADFNVNNAGLTVGAFRLGITGLTAATVNGVTFQPFAFADHTNAAVTIDNFTINPSLPFEQHRLRHDRRALRQPARRHPKPAPERLVLAE